MIVWIHYQNSRTQLQNMLVVAFWYAITILKFAMTERPVLAQGGSRDNSLRR